MQIREPLLHYGLVLYAGKVTSMSVQGSFSFHGSIKKKKVKKQVSKQTTNASCMPLLLW